MDFNPSPEVESLRERIEAFMDEHCYPVEAEVIKAIDDEVKPGVPYPEILVEIRAKAKEEGLWNLFLPGEEFGAGLTNWEYGILCEQMGRSPIVAPISFNCSAPDTGNSEILADHGTPSPRSPAPTRPRSRPVLSWLTASGSSTGTSGSPRAPTVRSSRSRWWSPIPTPPPTRGRA